MTQPTAPATDPSAQDLLSIDAYLRTHAGRYRYQELDAQLRAAGHGEDAIAAGWRRLAPGGSMPADLPAGGVAGFVHAMGFLVLGVLYGASIIGAGLSVLGNGLATSGGVASLVDGILLVLVALVGVRYLGRLRARRAGLANTIAALILFGVLWFAIIAFGIGSATVGNGPNVGG